VRLVSWAIPAGVLRLQVLPLISDISMTPGTVHASCRIELTGQNRDVRPFLGVCYNFPRELQKIRGEMGPDPDVASAGWIVNVVTS
jgi:hypothetical protein